MKAFGWRVFLATIGLAVGLSIFLLLQPQPVEVDVAQVRRGPLVVTIRDDGRTRIRERYVVSAPLSGRLVRITLDPGDTIQAGETLLATIEPTDASLLDPRAVAQAKARVKAAEARLQRARPQLKSAELALNYAETEMGRLRKLVDRDAGSQQQLDEQILAFRRAGNEFDSARFELDIARFELEVAKAALMQTGGPAEENTASETDVSADDNSDQWAFRIRSPISGHVLRVFHESSTIVTAGERLLEIGDASDLEVEVDVLSTKAVKIKPGARVMIDDWGGDHVLSGQVRLVEPSAFTKVSSLGIEEQRVNVIVDFASHSEDLTGLGDGFRVEAAIVEWESDDVLLVPVGALFREGDAFAVYAVRAGRSAINEVVIGHRNDEFAEVVEGLQTGDRVVLYPGDRVENGVRLSERPLTKNVSADNTPAAR